MRTKHEAALEQDKQAAGLRQQLNSLSQCESWIEKEIQEWQTILDQWEKTKRDASHHDAAVASGPSAFLSDSDKEFLAQNPGVLLSVSVAEAYRVMLQKVSVRWIQI